MRAFDEILERVGPVQGVITHSMGGAVTLSSRHPAIDALPLLLISPVLDYVPQLYGMVARSGYSIRLFDAVVKEIEHEYQHPLSTVDPLAGSPGAAAPPSSCTMRKTASPPTGTPCARPRMARPAGEHPGLGHGRILASPPAFAAFDQLSQTPLAN
nr:hypothetical protein [Aeromonas caviae]